jgi:hypothetical protein
MKGTCVGDCSSLGLCQVEMVDCFWVMSVQEGGVVWLQVRGELEGKVRSGERVGEGKNKLLDRGAMHFSTGDG